MSMCDWAIFGYGLRTEEKMFDTSKYNKLYAFSICKNVP